MFFLLLLLLVCGVCLFCRCVVVVYEHSVLFVVMYCYIFALFDGVCCF